MLHSFVTKDPIYNDAYNSTEIRRQAIIICSQRSIRTWAATSLTIIAMWKEF